MAILQVTVPDPLIPELAAMAVANLTSRGIPTNGMTNAQLGRRYIAEVVRDALVIWRQTGAQATAQTTVDAAVNQARTDAGGIT